VPRTHDKRSRVGSARRSGQSQPHFGVLVGGCEPAATFVGHRDEVLDLRRGWRAGSIADFVDRSTGLLEEAGEVRCRDDEGHWHGGDVAQRVPCARWDMKCQARGNGDPLGWSGLR
jgi:hypothetical protein